MKCPRCGARTYRSLGGKDICPSCGYGSSTGVKAPLALPSASYPASSSGTEQETQSVIQQQERPSESTLTTVSANTRFGFKLFAEIIEKDTGKNVFISPSSIAVALAMTYNGAKGETRQAMADALELKGMSLQEVNEANAILLAALKGPPDPKVELAIANSLWARKDLAFQSEFLRRNRVFYGAEVANLDFIDPSTLSTINSWVKDKTNGKIDDLVKLGDLDALTALILINAIYFKGIWKEQFDREKTKEGTFALLDGRRKQLPMMSRMGWYDYCECDDFQAISLPYGKGKISMYIFLPSKAIPLRDFQRSLNPNNWQKWLSWFHWAEGTIVLPRFKVEYEVELSDALKALGMGMAFGPGANFEGICADPLWISVVRHKTHMEVNEEGTEAAAATAEGMALGGVPERFTMVVDRPFFCAIRDNETGEVLFIGSVVEPG